MEISNLLKFYEILECHEAYVGFTHIENFDIPHRGFSYEQKKEAPGSPHALGPPLDEYVFNTEAHPLRRSTAASP